MSKYREEHVIETKCGPLLAGVMLNRVEPVWGGSSNLAFVATYTLFLQMSSRNLVTVLGNSVRVHSVD